MISSDDVLIFFTGISIGILISCFYKPISIFWVQYGGKVSIETLNKPPLENHTRNEENSDSDLDNHAKSLTMKKKRSRQQKNKIGEKKPSKGLETVQSQIDHGQELLGVAGKLLNNILKTNRDCKRLMTEQLELSKDSEVIMNQLNSEMNKKNPPESPESSPTAQPTGVDSKNSNEK